MYYGVIAILEAYGESAFRTPDCETKEEALIMLGRHMMRYPSYAIASCEVFEGNDHVFKVVYSKEWQNKQDITCSVNYMRNHHNENKARQQHMSDAWMTLYDAENDLWHIT